MADINPYLDIIKNASSGDSVRDAIINCMNEINKDSAFTVTDKVISGKISEINNGSPYTAPSGQVWKHVTLNIQDDSGEDYPSSNVKVIDFEVNDNTPNGEYSAADDERYGTITVNVSHAGEWEGIVDNVAISTLDLDDTNTYHASVQGYTAVKSVTFTNVNAAAARGGEVINGQTYYTITYKNKEGRIVDTQKVASGYTADYYGPMPPDEAPPGRFDGWEPTPTGVYSSMTCTPIYGTGDISHDTIPSNVTWGDLKGTGRSYDLGSIKSLTLTGKIKTSTLISSVSYSDELGVYKASAPNGDPHNITIPMMLVAKGEGNTGTTWLSTQPVPGYILTNEAGTQYNLISIVPDSQTFSSRRMIMYRSNRRDDWGSSYIKQWLDKCFYSALPSDLQRSIVAVKKQYMGVNDHDITSPQLIQKESSDKLWLPAVGEFSSWLPNDVSNVETGCVDYHAASGWLPETTGLRYDQPYRMYTRSVRTTGSTADPQSTILFQINEQSTSHQDSIIISSVSNAAGCMFTPYGDVNLPSGFYFGFCL